MATILFASLPLDGHVRPMKPLAMALADRGHEVLWYTSERYDGMVRSAGATRLDLRHGRDLPPDAMDALLAQRGDLEGIRGLQWDLKHVFIESALGYRRDLEAIYSERDIDIVVAEPPNFATTILAPLNAPPTVGLGIIPLGVSSVDTAPFGLGMPPSASALGRLRNRTLGFFVRKAVFGPVDRYANDKRRELGMPPMAARSLFEEVQASLALYLQATVEEFEYPRSDLPDKVRFIGPLLPRGSGDFEPPAWWADLDGSESVVLVTQGTVAKDPSQLIIPALDGLADEPVVVVVTAPGWAGPEHPPKNARIAEFLPYADLLPKVDVVVSNGGYGGVQYALAHGVPLVVAGTTEEKPEINARVAWSGVGIDLGVQSPKPEAVRDAVRRVIRDGRFRASAERVRDAMARSNAGLRGAELIEREIARAKTVAA